MRGEFPMKFYSARAILGTNERHPMFHFCFLSDKLVDNPKKPGKDSQLVNSFRIQKCYPEPVRGETSGVLSTASMLLA